MVTPTVKQEVNPQHEMAAAALIERNKSLAQAGERLHKSIGAIARVVAEKNHADGYAVIGEAAGHIVEALKALTEAAEQHKKSSTN